MAGVQPGGGLLGGAEAERGVGVRPVPAAGDAVDPGVQVAAVEAEGVQVLLAEPGRLQRHSQHRVDQVALALEYLTGRKPRAVRALDEHAPAIGQERHEGHVLDLLRGRLSLDQREHSLAG